MALIAARETGFDSLALSGRKLLFLGWLPSQGRGIIWAFGRQNTMVCQYVEKRRKSYMDVMSKKCIIKIDAKMEGRIGGDG